MPNIEQRGENTWRLIVYNGYKANGDPNRERRKITVEDPALLKSKVKLQQYLESEWYKFKEEVETGQYIKIDKVTFEAFVPEWKKGYAEQKLGGYTRRNYYGIISSQLLPEFGHVEINKIKTIHIVKFMTRLTTASGRKDGKSKPLATNTQLNIYRTLKSIMDTAAKWKIISSNPMEGVDRPTHSKTEKREMKKRKKSLTPEETKYTIEKLRQVSFQWRMYYVGVILGGFRRGEMLGVEWPAVDFESGGIHVEKQITFDEDSNPVEGEVKTEESEGFVPMPQFYMNALRKFKQAWEEEKDQLGSKWKGGEKLYVFHSGCGEGYYPDAPTRQWARIKAKYNLPPVRLHDLRHTTAMLLREEQVDMKSIQERLRHSRLETTSNIYTHESETISRFTADRLEKYSPVTPL
ncbi:tyrosine-type recombinase/integrase [Cohnella nanjingensis]|uniref:Site-specific integrase n=1 Tax=Cohnella nanjingensis TaxID=1387779 RepID=A0A7X0VF46_9BACL|nr:site-specific integrase [Cohnella nanjingensis]MBB6670239.1 site-specific integrase [Cohnella nanjingensis]